MNELSQTLPGILSHLRTLLQDYGCDRGLLERKGKSLHHDDFAKLEKGFRAHYEDCFNQLFRSLHDYASRVAGIQGPLRHYAQVPPERKSGFPAWLSAGVTRIAVECLHKDYPFPCVVPFPLTAPVCLEDTPAHRQGAEQLVLRLLLEAPPDAVKLSVIDPCGLGRCLGALRELPERLPDMFSRQRIATRTDEIYESLERVLQVMERRIQHEYSPTVDDWGSYNRLHPEAPQPYHVLLMYSPLTAMDSRSLPILQRILDNGPGCGVLPVLLYDADSLKALRDECLIKRIETCREQSPLCGKRRKEKGFSLEWEPADLAPDAAAAVVAEIVRMYAVKAASRSVEDYWGTAGMYAQSSAACIEAPLGWTDEAEPAVLRLGAVDSEHHLLVGGSTGSGKSNLLHVLIHNLCHRYSPEELRLYLMDYKDGVEFAGYAGSRNTPALPHAELVTVGSDVEYGIAVLEHLVAEMGSRSELFKRAAAKDLPSYRANTGGKMPRILLVIDEFQQLLNLRASKAEDLLNRLLRQGRSCGIHIVLATQSISGLQAASTSALLSQIGCRIALNCSDRESASLLGTANTEAQTLTKAKEAILNDRNGAPEYNCRFTVPYADPELCSRHAAALHAKAHCGHMAYRNKVFTGNALPPLPSAGEFKDRCGTQPRVWLGRLLDFEENPLVVPVGPRGIRHLLMACGNESLFEVMVTAIVRSIQGCADSSILLFKEGAEPVEAGNVKVVSTVEDLKLDELAAQPREGELFVVLIEPESCKEFNAPARFALNGQDDTSLRPQLESILRGKDGHIHVFAMVRQYQQMLGMEKKDLISCFPHRVVACIPEAPAHSLAKDGVGLLPEAASPERAVFSDVHNMAMCQFKPFAKTNHETNPS